MKTLFFGTPDFALSSALACHKHSELLAVVSQPDRPRGRGHKLSPCEVKDWAIQNHLPTFSPSSIKKPSDELSNLLSFIEKSKPDLFVVTAYGNILPESFLALPRLGSINVHASLLPKWRGAAPIQRSIEAGELETGVCIQKMVYELDAGEVLSEVKTSIDPNENSLLLSKRLSSLGGELLSAFLASPVFVGTVQDPSLISYAKKIDKSEGLWNPDWSAEDLHNRSRAFAAWPQVKARLTVSDTRTSFVELKLLETKLFAPANTSSAPFKGLSSGSLIVFDNKLLLFTGPKDNVRPCELLRVQAAGRAASNALDYFQNLFQNSKSQPRLEAL